MVGETWALRKRKLRFSKRALSMYCYIYMRGYLSSSFNGPTGWQCLWVHPRGHASNCGNRGVGSTLQRLDSCRVSGVSSKCRSFLGAYVAQNVVPDHHQVVPAHCQHIVNAGLFLGVEVSSRWMARLLNERRQNS